VRDADSDDDGRRDGDEDYDRDGIANEDEFARLGTIASFDPATGALAVNGLTGVTLSVIETPTPSWSERTPSSLKTRATFETRFLNSHALLEPAPGASSRLRSPLRDRPSGLAL
jgi:hypothetical protein